jgi:hypothetical protein
LYVHIHALQEPTASGVTALPPLPPAIRPHPLCHDIRHILFVSSMAPRMVQHCRVYCNCRPYRTLDPVPISDDRRPRGGSVAIIPTWYDATKQGAPVLTGFSLGLEHISARHERDARPQHPLPCGASRNKKEASL